MSQAMPHLRLAAIALAVLPLTDALSAEGLRLLAGGLEGLGSRGSELLDARGAMLAGAWLCGHVLGQVEMGLHHKLCHVLGGRFDLPHAPLHAVLLPYVLAFNTPYAPLAVRRIGSALGTSAPARWLRQQLLALPGPHSLSDLGLKEADLAEAVALAGERPYPNPAPTQAAAIEQVLFQALHGAAVE